MLVVNYNICKAIYDELQHMEMRWFVSKMWKKKNPSRMSINQVICCWSPQWLSLEFNGREITICLWGFIINWAQLTLTDLLLNTVLHTDMFYGLALNNLKFYLREFHFSVYVQEDNFPPSRPTVPIRKLKPKYQNASCHSTMIKQMCLYPTRYSHVSIPVKNQFILISYHHS